MISVSCAKTGTPDGAGRTFFTAYSEQNATRTVLGEDFKIRWSETDAISVFSSDGTNHILSDVKVSGDGLEATFSGKEAVASPVLALCPADAGAVYGDGRINVTIPPLQAAVAGSFDPAANVAVSEISDDELYFRNAGTLLGVRINNENITSFTIYGDEAGDRCISGRGDVTMTGGIPYAACTSGADSVTVAGQFDMDEVYYAVVYPGKYRNVRITFRDMFGRTASYSNSQELDAGRNGAMVISDFSIPENAWKQNVTPVSSEWTLVTSTAGLVSGNLYIMACTETGSEPSAVAAADMSSGSQILSYVSIESFLSKDKKTLSSAPDGALQFTLSGVPGAWKLSNANGVRLGATAVKKLAWGSGTTDWKISFSQEYAVIENATSSYGKFYYNAGSPRFTTYTTTGQKQVRLYSGNNVSGVTTVAQASDVTSSSATLEAGYHCISSVPSQAGFRYSTSSSSLTAVEYSAAPASKDGSFSVNLGGLKASTTYYYQAFVVEDGSAVFGAICSFTTSPSGGGSTGKADYGWAELPAQTDRNGDGIDDIDKDLYYSHTFRADASKVRNFSSCYSKGKVHPVWVAAPLHKCYLGSSGRSGSYKPDPNISCTQSSKFDGYTRGHMISSSERTVSKATNGQAFYYSNIGAQMSSGFNTGGGAWNNLEDRVDGYVCADTLYQVVGCIFTTFTDKYKHTVQAKTGTNSAGDRFQVPTAWYKVLLRTKKGNTGKNVASCSADELQCAAFILGHYSNASHKPCANDMYSVTELEQLTGMTFFVNVPNAPKSTLNTSDWGL